jgi:hypothetical protein
MLLACHHQSRIVQNCELDAKIVIKLQIPVKVLVHKLHVDRCKRKLLSKGDDAYHVPLENAPIADLIVVFAITDKWILRVDVNNLIGSAFTFYSSFFGLN